MPQVHGKALAMIRPFPFEDTSSDHFLAEAIMCGRPTRPPSSLALRRGRAVATPRRARRCSPGAKTSRIDDIALHLAAHEGWGLPTSYADAFDLLARNHVLTPEHARELSAVAS